MAIEPSDQRYLQFARESAFGASRGNFSFGHKEKQGPRAAAIEPSNQQLLRFALELAFETTPGNPAFAGEGKPMRPCEYLAIAISSCGYAPSICFMEDPIQLGGRQIRLCARKVSPTYVRCCWSFGQVT